MTFFSKLTKHTLVPNGKSTRPLPFDKLVRLVCAIVEHRYDTFWMSRSAVLDGLAYFFRVHMPEIWQKTGVQEIGRAFFEARLNLWILSKVSLSSQQLVRVCGEHASLWEKEYYEVEDAYSDGEEEEGPF